MVTIKVFDLQPIDSNLFFDSGSYMRELSDGEIVLVGGGYDVVVGIYDGLQCTTGGNVEVVTDGKGNWGVHDYDRQMSY